MNNAAVTVRKAQTREDGGILLRLIRSLAEFEALTPPDEAAAERFLADGFDREPPRFEAWIAEHGDAGPVGYALCFETYSTFLCRPSIYLEDLFVVPEHRGAGIGRILLQTCIGIASERGCGRMEWACLDWNVNAQAFYESLGARRLAEWQGYRLEADAIARRAQEDR